MVVHLMKWAALALLCLSAATGPAAAYTQPKNPAKGNTAEEAASTEANSHPAAGNGAQSGPTRKFAEGSHVKIASLRTEAFLSLNGKEATVVKTLDDGRYEVAVKGVIDHFALKEQNLVDPKSYQSEGSATGQREGELSATAKNEGSKDSNSGSGAVHRTPTLAELREQLLPSGQYVPSEEALKSLSDSQIRDLLRQTMVENKLLSVEGADEL